jgi:cell wall assembly regulator SMI1
MKIDSFNWKRLSEPMSESVIKEAEVQLGVTFPEEVFELFRKYHGASLPDYGFDYLEPELGKITTCIGEIFNFKPNNFLNLLEMNKDLSEEFPQGIIAIAMDPGGNYVCLDYRNKNEKEPSVVYCSLETGLEDPFIFVANSFTSFLDMLRLDLSD